LTYAFHAHYGDSLIPRGAVPRPASEERQMKDILVEIAGKCSNCGVCVQECDFLRRHGTPGKIAAAYDPSDRSFSSMPFECSLCGLCAAVCPEKIDPAELFLEMRREKKRRDPADRPEHKSLLAYEDRGTSRLFTYYVLPAGCDTVFFPGCALPGTRPDRTLQLYRHMRKSIPALGIVLDCCMKISHDLGNEDHSRAMFGEMRDFLVQNGVASVLVACPNCHRMFRAYGEGLAIKTVYEALAQDPPPPGPGITEAVTVHDPCGVRFEPAVHEAVRQLVGRLGMTNAEMAHCGPRTLCCGGGGSVACMSPGLAGAWGEIRKDEACGKRIVTYCAGCVERLNVTTPTSHIVDLLFGPRSAAGHAGVSRSPWTYLNRLKLKMRLRKEVRAPITRKRTFTAGTGKSGASRFVKPLLLLALLAAAFAAARYSGISQRLEPEAIRGWIQGYGALAPLVYMLTYTVAPALLLPGLPLTIAGGILFGPFWGVVYAIAGATLGACVAFLAARHIARDWVERRLQGPRWRRLDQAVEEQGWKIVAFTRLVPLFPFNLLNYAFGLTRIRFLHYALATFVFMLPACIAFIVFSSSLPDLIQGRISASFVAGLGLVLLILLVPVFYRRYRNKKGMKDPL